MEEHARRMAERAEAMAEHAQVHGERMRIVGLSSGLHGMEAGLHGIDRALERGWVTEDGERRQLTQEEIEDLTEAREDLQREIEEFRAEHADILPLLEDQGERRVYLRRLSADAPHTGTFVRHGGDGALEGGPNVRILRRDGEVRVWLDGEELEGEDLQRWLEENNNGEPPAPPAPPAPPRR